jgi:hypothetical protein
MTKEAISEGLVDDETLYNDIARYIHKQRHKSERTYFCESDRRFAEELIQHFIEDRGWVVIFDENNRNS